MKAQASRIILEVERAASDLRRAQPVLLTENGKPDLLVLSGEHYPALPITRDASSPAVQLMKLCGLLPVASVRTPERDETTHLLAVSAEAIAAYPESLALSLEKVSEAAVPLPETGSARFIAFRPRFGHEEHLAVVIGDPSTMPSPYVRLHSSCVTGDIFASLRCDCGSQLHASLRMISEQGAGVVLYLSQEGRGIGIANKLRAYALQDKGMDTVESNLALGFEADERDFAIAASMLRQLGLTRITLLTNNPKKLEELTRHGITVTERKPVMTLPTEQNQAYLATKASKMRHVLAAPPCGGN